MILPTDICHVLMLQLLVSNNRTISNTSANDNPSSNSISYDVKTSLLLLKYFSDNISQQYNTITELKQKFLAYLSINSSNSDANCVPIFSECQTKLYELSCVDDLMDLFETVKDIFELDKNLSLNNCVGPIRICANSFLGVYIRANLLQWDTYDFQQICEIYESLQDFITVDDFSIDSTGFSDNNGTCVLEQYDQFHYKLGISDEIVSINNNGMLTRSNRCKNKRTNIVESHFPNEITAREKRTELLLDTFKYKSINDNHQVEMAIHSYFDYQSEDPLQQLPVRNNCSISTSNNLSKQLQTELQKLQFPNLKHQYAMLAIANNWVQCGNSTMALLAIEEGIKISHQKGDHIFIAQALLLLQKVLYYNKTNSATNTAFHSDGSDSNCSSNTITIEDILKRCLLRCTSLQIPNLAIHCSVDLANIKSKGKLLCSYNYPSNLFGSINDSNDGGEMSWRVADVWMQINSALLGELLITSHTALTNDITQLENKRSITKQQPNTNVQKDSNNIAEMPAKFNAEFIENTIHLTMISCNMWIRFDLLEMAEFVCSKTLKLYSIYAKSEQLINLYCKIIKLYVDIAYRKFLINTSNLNTTASEAADVCSTSLEAIKQYIKVIKNYFCASKPYKFNEIINSCSIYVSIYQHLCRSNIQKALQNAKRYTEITATGYRTENSYYNSISDVIQDCGSGICAADATKFSNSVSDHLQFVDYHCATVILSEENLQARIIYGKIIGTYYDNTIGVQILSDVAQVSKENGFWQIYIEALATKAECLHKYYLLISGNTETVLDTSNNNLYRKESIRNEAIALAQQAYQLGREYHIYSANSILINSFPQILHSK